MLLVSLYSRSTPVENWIIAYSDLIFSTCSQVNRRKVYRSESPLFICNSWLIVWLLCIYKLTIYVFYAENQLNCSARHYSLFLYAKISRKTARLNHWNRYAYCCLLQRRVSMHCSFFPEPKSYEYLINFQQIISMKSYFQVEH